jgi:hypothetical protein
MSISVIRVFLDVPSSNFNQIKTDEPSHDKIFDTHADDYNSQHGKTISQSIVGELHLTILNKL